MEDHLDSFVCPITHEVMEDPVVASDGHSYERSSISRWFRQNNTSPITNNVVAHKTLVPNHALKQAIVEFREKFAPFIETKPRSPSPRRKEPLPQRGTFIYAVVRPMPIYLAPSFVLSHGTMLNVDTIVIGKERLYGEDNVVFVELSGHHEGKYVFESRDGLSYLERLDMTEELSVYVVSTTVPLSLWPSPSVPSNSLYKAYPWDVLSIEATIEDRNGTMYGRLECSKLWVRLSPNFMTQWPLNSSPHVFLLPRAVDLCTNANTTALGVPLIEIPSYTLVKSHALIHVEETWYIRTTHSSFTGWLSVQDVMPLEGPPPRIAEGPAGKLIQFALQQDSMALILDEIQESGDVSQRMFMRHLPRRFERQLLNCAQKGRRVHRIALGPRGEWYCSGAKPDGSGECCRASDDLPLRFRAEMEPNSLVAFGQDDEYAMILGQGGLMLSNLSTSLLIRLRNARRVHMIVLARYGGYAIKDNRGLDCSCLDPAFEDALRHPPRGAGQVCSAVYSDDEFVVLFEHDFVASSGFTSHIFQVLRDFYDRHRAMRQKRRQLISEYQRLCPDLY
ncbi:unnamed protein product [Aphanomyces euteiches]